MPYCPVCKHQYDEPATECPKDHVALVGELPFQTVDAGDETWVEIASVGTDDEARILAGYLEAEGIPAQVESLKFTMEPVNLGTMSEIRIYVSAENEERAMRLVENRREEFADRGDEEDEGANDEPASVIDEGDDERP
ncbi:MAG: hypothetical protein ABR524_02135 [Thermoanaerobaculia bacterium]